MISCFHLQQPKLPDYAFNALDLFGGLALVQSKFREGVLLRTAYVGLLDLSRLVMKWARMGFDFLPP